MIGAILISRWDIVSNGDILVLTFESVDEILWFDHSNETSLAALLHGTICFSKFCK